jgi:hypothetical protein
MSAPIREKDGRFKPRTGQSLPPKPPQNARDEHGRWIPNEKVQSSKPYSRAVRELLDAPEGGIPESWDPDPKKRTEAQRLAMVHMAMAASGNVQIGMIVIDRAEGKVPQAAEDREAVIKAGEGVKMLAGLLGIDMLKVIDTEVIDDKRLGPGTEASEVAKDDGAGAAPDATIATITSGG